MKISMRVTKPAEIPVTMTMTMPLSEWRELREQVKGKWPGSDLSYAISNMLSQVERTFEPAERAVEED